MSAHGNGRANKRPRVQSSAESPGSDALKAAVPLAVGVGLKFNSQGQQALSCCANRFHPQHEEMPMIYSRTGCMCYPVHAE